MKTFMFNNLPRGTRINGSLYLDPTMRYESGDVLEVELPTGTTIDVGWDDESPGEPFRIVVYRDYFGDRFVDFRVREIEDVGIEVQRLITEYSGPITVSSCAVTNTSIDPSINQSTVLLRSKSMVVCTVAVIAVAIGNPC